MLREWLYETAGDSKVKTPTVENPIETPKVQTQNKEAQTPTVATTATPTVSTTQTTTAPEQSQVSSIPTFSQSDIAFWDTARQRQEQDQSYLQNRNQLLASGFSKQGITDEQGIQDYLSKTSEFKSQSLEDQQNTAREIARLTQTTQESPVFQDQTTLEASKEWQVGQTPIDDTQTTTQADVIQAATKNTIENEQQEFLQQVNRRWKLYDRNVEDLEEQDRLFNEKLDREIEQTKTQIERQVDDVVRQTVRATNQYAKVWALKWFTGSGYTQGIMNIKDDAQKTVSRLQSDLSNYLNATWEAKANAAKQLNTNLARAKEDFEFAMRDVMSLASIDVNQLTSQYGLDPDKMANRLDSITLDVLQKQEELTNSYLTNARTAIQLANDELATIQAYESQLETETTQFASNLIDTWGSMNEVNALLQSWELSTKQAQTIFAELVRNTTATLDAQLWGTWLAWQFTGEIQAGIQQWLTPYQVLDWILASDKYQTIKESNKEYKTVNLWNGMIARIDPTTGEPTFMEAPIGAREEREQTREDQEFALQLRKIQQDEQMNALRQEAQQIENEQQRFTFRNDQLKETSDPLARAEIIAQKNGNVNADGTITIPQGKRWHQCGEFVNDALNLPSWWASTRFVNSYEDKLKMDNSSEVNPTIGSALIESTGNQYGHVALINGEWVDENGEYRTLTESNQASSGKVTTDRKVYKDDPNIWGYYTKTQAETSSPFMEAFNLINFSKPTLAEREQWVIQWLIDSGRTDQAKIKLEWLVTEWLGSTAKNEYEATRVMTRSLGTIEWILDELDSKWVDTWILQGKYENLTQRFWDTWDPEIARLWVLLKDQLDSIRRARSWAALTEFEEAFYDSIFPSNEKNYSLNKATIQWFTDSRNIVKESYLKNAYGDELVNEIRWGNEYMWIEPQETVDYFTSWEASVGSTWNQSDDEIISLFQ